MKQLDGEGAPTNEVAPLPRGFEQTSRPIGMRSLRSFAFLTVGSGLLIGVLLGLQSGSSILTIVKIVVVCLLIALAICGFVATTSFVNATTYRIFCTPEGFSVTSGKRSQWHNTVSYAWSSILETGYSEIYFRIRIAFFRVQTKHGCAFEVDDWHLDDFDELVEVFNAMTPHLGYAWKKQERGLRRYGKVARA